MYSHTLLRLLAAGWLKIRFTDINNRITFKVQDKSIDNPPIDMSMSRNKTLSCWWFKI